MSVIDLEVVDAQVHVWGEDSPERPWDSSVAIAPHGPPGMPASTVLAAMSNAKVNAGLIIPVSFEGNRNDLGIAACERWPHQFGMLGRFDFSDPGAATSILEHMGRSGFLGVRMTFNRDAETWLRDGTLDWFWPFAERENVPIALFPKGDLGILLEIANRHPGLKITIDHLATSEPQNGYDTLDRIRELEPLGAAENISVKATALPISFPTTYSPELVRTVIDLVLDWFGTGRVFWGSDYTRYHDGLDYGHTVQQFRDGIAHLAPASQRAIMGGSLREWFNWETGRPTMSSEHAT